MNGFLMILLAGILNATFPVPTKFMRRFQSNAIWLLFACVGLIVMPWLFVFILFPAQSQVYLNQPESFYLLTGVGGVVFGLGQVCFAIAIDKIGLAASFVVNLGLSVALGTLLSLFYFPASGLSLIILLLAVVMVLLALVLYYFALRSAVQGSALLWLLAVFAGIASACQNVVFVKLASTAMAMQHTFLIWPPFLFFAGVVMLLGFAIKIFRDETSCFQRPSWGVFAGICIMGILFTGSICLYSLGVEKLGVSRFDSFAWPLFMISIIFATQCWGMVFRENTLHSLHKRILYGASLLLLILSVVLITQWHR